MQINILGTTYTIKDISDRINPEALENISGQCDYTSKTIELIKHTPCPDDLDDLEYHRKSILRHEIIHAYLFESGLRGDSSGNDCWAMNEEMIDWIAMQFPKIYKTFAEADCM